MYQNEDVGLVLSGDTPIFPADFGNYFYLRLPNNVSFSSGGIYAISDSVTGLGLNAVIVLVAIVQGGKNDLLLNNLVNTLQNFCGETNDFTTAIYNTNEVIRQELAFMPQESRDKALANIPDNLSVVSLSFTYSVPFTFSNCIVNPCSC